jgi:hypothetical protein
LKPSGKPFNIDLGEGQEIIPIKLEGEAASLSAILLNDDYYNLIRERHNEEKNLPFANPGNFLSIFPPDNKDEWVAIGAGLKTTFGGTRFAPEALIGAIQTYFKL